MSSEVVAIQHKEIKAGRAARVHWQGDNATLNDWLDQIASSNIKVSNLSESTIEALNALFHRKRFNHKKIKCFFDRLDGMTFVEMSEKDPSSKTTPDKYRKRFKRMVMPLERNKEELRDILLGT